MDTMQDQASVSSPRIIAYPGPLEAQITPDSSFLAANLEAFINRKHEKHPTTKTAETYRRALRPFLAFCKQMQVNQPTAGTMEAYKSRLLIDIEARVLRKTTASAQLGTALQFSKWLFLTGQLDNDPARGLDGTGIDGISVSGDFKKLDLSLDQVREIMTQIPADNLRDRAIMLLLFSTGLRCVEVIRAEVQDLTLIGGTYTLAVQRKGHLDKDQEINVPAETMKAILAYLASRGNPAGTAPLFASDANRNRGKALTTLSVSRLVKGYFRAAGWNSDSWTAHSTRHTFANLALEAGTPVQVVQSLLGHVNLNTTMKYVHQRDRRSNRTAQAVESLILGTAPESAH